MGFRTVYGNTHSENGWPMVDQGSCEWVTVPGTNVTIQIQSGWPLAILRAWVADHHAYVEPVRDADTACWTETNSVASSNHLSGSAVDVDWSSHRFHISYDGYSPQQIATVRELLDFYEKTVFWGQDWGGNPYDCMHFQVGYDTYNNPHTQNFITRKIRADGFSTFRRGSMPATPPAAQVLSEATGLTLARAIEILPTVISGLQASKCTNVNRIAMWLAQCGVESAGFSTTEEFASGAEYEGRCSDLGNCSPGDGVKYKGRTWIQITGKAHYREFSEWAFNNGLFVSSPTQFVDNPSSLGELRWAGIGAAWYWTVSRPDINALSDAGDVVTVTHRINGGEHGLADRQQRYVRAHNLGDRLLVLTNALPTQPPSGEDDFLSELSAPEQRALFNAIMNQRQSRSPFRHLGEGTVGDTPDQIWDMDGSIHILVVYLLASLGHPGQLALLNEVASADSVRYPDRQQDKILAQAVLAELQSPSDPVARSAPVPTSNPAPAAAPTYMPTEVLPAIRESVPAQGNTPEDLLDKMDKLKVFAEAFSEKLKALTNLSEEQK